MNQLSTVLFFVSEYTTGNLARARNARGEGERKLPTRQATGNFAISTKPGMND